MAWAYLLSTVLLNPEKAGQLSVIKYIAAGLCGGAIATATGLGYLALTEAPAHGEHTEPSAITLLDATFERFEDRLSALEERIDSLTVASRPVVKKPALPPGVNIFSGTLAELKFRVRELESRTVKPALADFIADNPEILSPSSSGPGRNLQGEAMFEAEPDERNTYYEQAVSDSLASLSTSHELQDLVCHGSVCKVTYEAPQDGGAALSTDGLMGPLMEDLAVSRVELRHGTDAYGNRVMYIRIP